MKYKLIKKLPFEGSPELGYISTPSKEKDGAHYWNHNFFKPDEFPEFWERVKEYEILSFYSGEMLFEKSSFLVHQGIREGRQVKYICDRNESIWNPLYKGDLKTLYHKSYIIASVKRLADGVVFSAGDEVCNKKKEEYNNFIIKKFTLSLGGVMLAIGSGGGISIDNIEHSEKEKDSELIYMNIPCLSIKEIAPLIGLANDSKHINLDDLTKKLIEKVKWKIK